MKGPLVSPNSAFKNDTSLVSQAERENAYERHIRSPNGKLDGQGRVAAACLGSNQRWSVLTAQKMAKRQKLKEKLLSGQHDRNFGFEDLCTLVRQLGFTERKTGGSHRIFHREGVKEIINLQPSKDRKAKPYQVKQVREIVNGYHL